MEVMIRKGGIIELPEIILAVKKSLDVLLLNSKIFVDANIFLY